MKNSGPADCRAEHRSTAEAVTLGTTMAVGMGLFVFLGYYVDRRRGGGIAFTVAGMFLGLAYCAYEAWKAIRLIEGDSPGATAKGPAAGKSGSDSAGETAGRGAEGEGKDTRPS